MTEESIIYQDGCHCASVRFQVVVDRHIVEDCNCSICRKKGFLHLIVPSEKFTLLSGAEDLNTYSFNTHIAKHTFCRICAIHPFYHPVILTISMLIFIVWMEMYHLNLRFIFLMELIGKKTFIKLNNPEISQQCLIFLRN